MVTTTGATRQVQELPAWEPGGRRPTSPRPTSPRSRATFPPVPGTVANIDYFEYIPTVTAPF